MGKGRLEAFSDGVIAIIITIMVQELQAHIIRSHGNDSVLAAAVGSDTKGKISLAAYLASVPLALFDYPSIAGALIIGVALMWFIPDRRIEKALGR